MNDRERYALQQAIAILNTVGIVPEGIVIQREGKRFLALLIPDGKFSDVGLCDGCGKRLEDCKGSNKGSNGRNR